MLLQEGHHRIFHPPLPAHKQEAIAKLAIGIVDKLFIRLYSPKQQVAESSGAAETAPDRSVLSQKLLWKVCSTVGNAGFNPTTQAATDSTAAAEPAAERSVLSHQLLWKVCLNRGTACSHAGACRLSSCCPSPWQSAPLAWPEAEGLFSYMAILLAGGSSAWSSSFLSCR